MQSAILIIDDSKDEALLTKAVLSKIGRDIRMKTEFDGEVGLSLLRNTRRLPALVLLDLKIADNRRLRDPAQNARR